MRENLLAIFKENLEQTDLSHKQDDLMNLLKPCVKIKLDKNLAITIGQSKIGGTPHLPNEVPYPFINKIPLRFLMQINLQELTSEEKELLYLPETGVLYFFIGEDDDSSIIPNKIIYSNGEPKLQKHVDVSDYYDQHDFSEFALQFIPWISLPNYGALRPEVFWHSVDEDQYYNLLSLLEGGYRNCSQLGGYPLFQYDDISIIQKKACLNYYGKELSLLKNIKKPEYPEYDVETAARMRLHLIAQDYKDVYQDKLAKHNNLIKWLSEKEETVSNFNLLLSLISHRDADMCWLDANEINFFALKDDVDPRTFLNTYAYIDPS